MRVIITGSRSLDKEEYIDVINKLISLLGEPVSEVVSGTARGIDRLGEKWAEDHNVPIKRFPADWDRYGKSAGYKRNEDMARYADALVVLWDEKSRGTEHMINIAEDYGLAIAQINIRLKDE